MASKKVPGRGEVTLHKYVKIIGIHMISFEESVQSTSGRAYSFIMSIAPCVLVVVTNDLVAQPSAIGKLKSDMAGYEVHQQLLDRLTEHAVRLSANKFSRIFITGGEIPGHVAEHLYDSLKENGVLSGQIIPKTRNSLIIAGFISSPKGWTKISGNTQRTSSLSLKIRGDGSSRKITKKTLAFKRASEPLDINNGDEDLIDEDDLVTDDLTPVYKIPAKCDSDSGKKRRKACRDCTCGLKEEEDAEDALIIEKQQAVMLNHDEIAEIDFTVPGKAVGGCGSCALGDAFRCDGCPYLGLPPFKPGEIVSVEQFGDDF